jgi:hypothetical protein
MTPALQLTDIQPRIFDSRLFITVFSCELKEMAVTYAKYVVIPPNHTDPR